MGYYRFTSRWSGGLAYVRWWIRSSNSDAHTCKWSRLSSHYGMRRHPVTGFNAMHRGIDFICQLERLFLPPDLTGELLAGMVTMANMYVWDITQPTRLLMHICHVSAGLNGRKVCRAKWSAIGSTGRSTGPHLHYEIGNNRQVNPLTVQLPAGKVFLQADAAFIAQVKAIEQKMKYSLTPNYAGVTLHLSFWSLSNIWTIRSDRNNLQPCWDLAISI